MRLDHTATVNCLLVSAMAYFNNVEEYCRIHTLKGSSWHILSPNTARQVMDMKSGHATECTYRFELHPESVFSEVISGEGKGTTQRILLFASGEYTKITWILEPCLGNGDYAKAILRILGEKKLAKMMQKSLENSARLDIDHLEKRK